MSSFQKKVLIGVGAFVLAVLLVYVAGPLSQGKSGTTPGGVKYEDVKVGTGPEAKEGDKVTVRYTATTKDGKTFESSDTQGGQGGTTTITLSAASALPPNQKWTEGIPGMKAGGERKLNVQLDLRSLAQQLPPGTPTNLDLIYKVELVAIEK